VRHGNKSDLGDRLRTGIGAQSTTGMTLVELDCPAIVGAVIDLDSGMSNSALRFRVNEDSGGKGSSREPGRRVDGGDPASSSLIADEALASSLLEDLRRVQ